MRPEHFVERGGQTEDEEFLASYCGGDVRAFEALVSRHWERLHNFVRARVHDWHDSEQITLDVLSAVQRRAGSYSEEKGAFKTWLDAIAMNMIRSFFRKKKRRPLTETDRAQANTESGEWSLDSMPASSQSPPDVLILKETRTTIRLAVERLPYDQREDVRRFYFEGQSHKHIAAQNGVSEAVSRARLHRSRLELKAVLGDYCI